MALVRETITQSEIKKPPENLLQEIRQTSILKLRPLTVHYANRALPVMMGWPVHGYAVIESKPQTIKVPFKVHPIRQTKFANTIYMGPSAMHAPFVVSQKLLQAVLVDMNYSEEAKAVLKEMQGQTFPAVELFFRQFLQAKKKYKAITISQEELQQIFYLAQDPYDFKATNIERHEILRLLRLNREINGEKGAVWIYDPKTLFCEADRIAFEKEDGVTHKAYPQVSIRIVHQLYQQQLLYQRYIEQKAGVGTSFEERKDIVTDKARIPLATTKKLIEQLIKFNDMPYFGGANCNITTATFLQHAENQSAKEAKRNPETIVSGTYVSFGSALRMSFWSPVRPLTHSQLIQKLITQPSFKIHDPVLFQELIDQKDKILTAIDTLPLVQQCETLERCCEEKTELGRIFHAKRSFTLRSPDKSRGYLSVIQAKLSAIKAELKKMRRPQEVLLPEIDVEDDWAMIASP